MLDLKYYLQKVAKRILPEWQLQKCKEPIQFYLKGDFENIEV